jgi:hypothetical protein
MWGWVMQGGSVLIRDLPLNDAGDLEDGFHRTPVPHKSCDMSGGLRTDFGPLPGGEMVTITRQSEHGLVTFLGTVPFGKSPQEAVAGDLLYFGAQDDFEVRVYGGDGSLQRIVRKDWSPVAVTEGDVAAYIEEEVAQVSDEEEARMRRRDLEGMPRAENRPPHGAIYADAGGYLFVEGYRVPGAAPVGVDVFDPEGRLAGHFELPQGLNVLEVGEDYVLGLRLDDLGVEYLGLYDLTRPG